MQKDFKKSGVGKAYKLKKVRLIVGTTYLEFSVYYT